MVGSQFSPPPRPRRLRRPRTPNPTKKKKNSSNLLHHSHNLKSMANAPIRRTDAPIRKRSKADLSKTGVEEDWAAVLQDNDGDLEPMVVDEERIVSRYASRLTVIVFRLARWERRRLKKLDLEGRTKGESSFVVAVWLPREWRKITIYAIYEF
ncbi:hypothetical protein AAG906_025855 [Vitis piasezkii]